MATKKQLEQLAKFQEKADTANAIRATAKVAGGFTAKSHKQQQEALKTLTEVLGSDKKAKKAIEDVAVSAGAKPKSIVRRILGT